SGRKLFRLSNASQPTPSVPPAMRRPGRLSKSLLSPPLEIPLPISPQPSSQTNLCSFPSLHAPGTRTGCEYVNTFGSHPKATRPAFSRSSKTLLRGASNYSVQRLASRINDAVQVVVQTPAQIREDGADLIPGQRVRLDDHEPVHVQMGVLNPEWPQRVSRRSNGVQTSSNTWINHFNRFPF